MATALVPLRVPVLELLEKIATSQQGDYGVLVAISERRFEDRHRNALQKDCN